MPNKDRNIPKRRFKAFENDPAWELRKIFEIADRFDNLRVPIASSLRVSGSTPYYGANGIQDYVEGYTHEGEFILVAEDGANDLKNYPVNLVNGKIWVNNHAHVLQGKNSIADNKFLAFSINQTNIESLLVGGGRAKLNSDVLMNIELKLPSPAEQEAIGTFFSTLDQHITLHQRKLDKLKSVKQAYLSEMFPAEGERVPKRRFPGFTDDWELRKLGEISTHRGGTAIENHFSEDGKYKVISIGSYGLDNKYIDQKIRAVENEVTRSKVVNKNELTMVLNDKTANGNIIGRCLLIEADDEFVINQRTEIISFNSVIYPKFAYVVLNGVFREQVKKIVQGGTQIYVNYSSVEQLYLSLPSHPEQEAIGTFFSTLDQHITLHQRKLEKLKNLKKALLNELFV
ncbi:restriction endonuclease subunit S [Streptococcus suis]|nr:restriction endonuclease subunit S [Streptococcus suis]